MSEQSRDGTVQCEYCDFKGAEGEVMLHLMKLREVPVAEHKRLSADELHKRYAEPGKESESQ